MSAQEAKRPFALFEWMMAFRYLRSRRREAFISIISWLSFFGIMLGVATLIIVMAVMNGFRTELLDKILGINGHLVMQPMGSEFTDYDAATKRIEGVNGVTYAIPFVEGQVLASGAGGAVGALVRGVSQDNLKKMKLVSDNFIQGKLEGFKAGDGIALGSRLARSLGVVSGDWVKLISPRGAVTPMGTVPRTKAYKVQAVFEIGMSEYDSTFVFMPIEDAQAYFGMDNKISALEVYIDDPDQVVELRAPVEEAVGRQVFVTDWRYRNTAFFSALEVERNMMFIILTLIILVAALNIISGLIMLVKDKGHDIAILRTMGATRASIMRIFVITGAAIGFVGTVAGFFLGLVVCLNIESIRQFVSYITNSNIFPAELYFLSKLPADMDPNETISVLVIALVLSFLATLYPAWRAATLDPVEALRYE